MVGCLGLAYEGKATKWWTTYPQWNIVGESCNEDAYGHSPKGICEGGKKTSCQYESHTSKLMKKWFYEAKAL